MMEGEVCILQNVSLFLKQCQTFFYDHWLTPSISIAWWVMGVDVGVNFFFVVKLDCSVATSTPSIFWLSFHLNICDKWVLTVNFSSSNVVLFYPMNVATNHTPQSYIPQGYSTLTFLCWMFRMPDILIYDYIHVYGSSFFKQWCCTYCLNLFCKTSQQSISRSPISSYSLSVLRNWVVYLYHKMSQKLSTLYFAMVIKWRDIFRWER